MSAKKKWLIPGSIIAIFAIWALIARYTNYLGEANIPIVFGVIIASIAVIGLHFMEL